MLLSLVHSLHGLQHFHRITCLVGSLDESLDILGETRTAISASGIKELAANTSVGTDTLAHHIHIRTDKFAEVRDVVHE